MAQPPAQASPAGQPPYPPGWTAKGPTNWKLVSGIVIFLGAAFIGVGFIMIAITIASSTYSASFAETYLVLWGLGIIFIGLSFVFSRMA